LENQTVLIFQSGKLGDRSIISSEIQYAKNILSNHIKPIRIYGLSGGALVAFAFGLALVAREDPIRWGKAQKALDEFSEFLYYAHSHNIHSFNINPLYGIFNLHPLRKWIAGRIKKYINQDDFLLSELGIQLYICAMNRDGTFSIFGPSNPNLTFIYQHVQVGPPIDAPVIDALIAALSTLLSTEPGLVNGEWYRDCRPAVVDGGAIIDSLEQAVGNQAVIMHRTIPYAPIRPWKLNWITSSFVMHSGNERNQTLLAAYYLDLIKRQRELQHNYQSLYRLIQPGKVETQGKSPVVGHVDLPYIGSTEASTNMRQSVENKDQLMLRFRNLLHGQLDEFPFDQPANVIYGAGGFSGILAGLVTARAVDTGFDRGGGMIQQVVGVSAGVLNGFFHAIQLAAARNPDLYKPAAKNALDDLEIFIAHIQPKNVVRLNINPIKFWQGWANLNPLYVFLCKRLAAYTGSKYPEQITFNDINLPMTVTAARTDGFTDFMGMTSIDRHMHFAGREIKVLSAPIVPAIIAGWSMNTYINPAHLNDQVYCDGGGTFYDVGLFISCMDQQLTNLLNIHLDEPEGHSYNIPPRPNLIRILLDTHNYYFPEERRRMWFLVNLLYEYYQLRNRYRELLSIAHLEIKTNYPIPPDFRREWEIFA